MMKFFNQKKWVEWNSDLPTKIDDYLKENFKDYHDNKSTKTHFFKPLLFFGLLTNIQNNQGNFLLLSMDGRKILECLESKQYDEALKHFFLSTLWTSYPNIAAPETENIYLFPFRILYSLIQQNGSLDIEEITTKVIFINQKEDFVNYENFKKNFYYDKNKYFNKTNHFKSWVINCLVDIGIFIKDTKGSISFSNLIRNFVSEENIDLENYENFFFSIDNANSFIDTKWWNNRVNGLPLPKRSKQLAKKSLEDYNYDCFIDKEHETFTTNEGFIFMESHHIIPFSLAKIVNGKNELDVIENLIPLCPNCHKAMHYSENLNKEQMLKKIWNEKEIDLTKMNFTFNDLLQIYMNNIYLKNKQKSKKTQIKLK